MADFTQHVETTGRWDDRGDLAAGRGALAGPGRPVRANGAEQRLARLVRTIEAEVIPRLVLARRAERERASARAGERARPSAHEVARLGELALGSDPGAASSYVAGIRKGGAAVEALYLDLLAPAARHLGDLWNADLRSFAEVTLGLCRLHQVLRELSAAFRSEEQHPHNGLRALLVPAPGEQHSFGLCMVAEFFRRAGWDVASEPAASRHELAGMAKREWFAVVGISVSSEAKLEGVASSIRAIRRASDNRSIGVMVGGPVLLEQPDLVARVGADATAIDGRQAVHRAYDLLALMATSR